MLIGFEKKEACGTLAQISVEKCILLLYQHASGFLSLKSFRELQSIHSARCCKFIAVSADL